MGRSAAVAALFLALAAAGAWFLVSSANREAPPAAPGKADVLPDAVAPPASAPAPAPAPPANSGVVEGTVTRDGKPCAARITAFRIHPAPTEGNSVEDWRAVTGGWDAISEAGAELLASTESGPDGRWSLRGLAASAVHFEAETADGARGGRDDAVGPEGTIVPGVRWGEPGPVSIEIQPGTCVLQGRVVRQDGTPWIGLVWAGRDAYQDDRPPPVRTGPDGTFRIRGLPNQNVTPLAGEPYRRTWRGPTVLLPFEEEVKFTLGAGTREVPGVVVEAATGRPVAGAKVRCSGRVDGWAEDPVERTTSDAAGRFLAHPVATGDYDVEVESEGFVPERLSVDGEKPAMESLEIRLHRGASVSGRVLEDGTDKPVAGVAVQAIGKWNDNDGYVHGSVSDAEGRYAIRDLPRGNTIVVAFGGGWAARGLAALGGWHATEETLRLEGAESAVKDLFVVRAPRIRGRVVDVDGSGVPGVAVGVDVAWDRRALASDALRLLSPVKYREELVSGPDGTFELPEVLPGVAYWFLAKRGKWVVAAAGPVGVLPRETAAGPVGMRPGETAEVLLRVPADRRLTVRTVDAETGAPFADLTVAVGAPFESGDSQSLGGYHQTGEDGTVELGPLPALPLEVSVCGYLGRNEGASVNLDAATEGTVELRIRREPPWAELPPIEGRVLFPDGTAAVGAEVSASAIGEDMVCHWGPGNRTDFLGRFRESRSQPGKYSISASISQGGKAFSAEAEVAEGVREVVLRLKDRARIEAGLEDSSPGPRLRVRLLGPGGEAIPGGRTTVHFLYGEDEDWEVRSIFEGLSSVPFPDGVEVERLWVEVGSAESAGRPLPLAHGVFGPFGGGTREVEVRLAAESAIEGRVLDPEGKGVPGIEVNATPTFSEIPGADSWGRREAAHAKTDAEGRFRIGGLAAREYELEVETGKAFTRPDPWRARPDGGEVVFRLRRSVEATILVLDYEGRPVAGARVYANGPGDSSESAETDVTGAALLSDLDPAAEYRIHVEPPDTRDDLVRLDLRDWKPARTEVRLTKGRVLVVRVRDPAGRPVEGVDVQGGGRSEETGADGIARLEELPFEQVFVTAALPRLFGGPTADARVDGEQVRLELVLDIGVELSLRVPGVKGGAHAKFARSGADSEAGGAYSENGEFRFRGLRADETYDLYVSEDSTSNSAVLRGLRPGGEIVTATLAEGMTIRGQVHVGEYDHVEWVTVLVGSAPLIDAAGIDEDGKFEIRCVPPGKWKIRAVVVVEGKRTILTADVDAGGTVEFKLR